MTTSSKKDSLNTMLTRGVETIYPSPEELKTAMGERKLTVYLGVDPTGDTIHLGHTIPLRKLRQFQEAGHNTILLIGDFTARIGDPTGKDKTRRPLTAEQVREHCATYREQLRHVLNFDDPENPTRIRYNSEWVDELTLNTILELASKFTVQQMIERDMFQKRLREEKPIGLHEFLYPLIQGYDSVALNADVEIGGTDQMFNMLAGRTLRKSMHDKEKFVVTVPLLTDASGKKIGKTEGNVIAIAKEPNDLFGKIMALADSAIIPTMRLATDILEEEIADAERTMAEGANPRDVKARLAFEIVKMYHSPEEAETAQREFENVFAKKELPKDMEEVKRSAIHGKNIAEVLVELNLAPSTNEAKRLIEQGAVKIDGERVDTWRTPLPQRALTLQSGKRKFMSITNT